MFVGKKLHHIYLFVLLQTQKKCTFEKRKCHEKNKNCSQDHWAYKNFIDKNLRQDYRYYLLRDQALSIVNHTKTIKKYTQCWNHIIVLKYWNEKTYLLKFKWIFSTSFSFVGKFGYLILWIAIIYLIKQNSLSTDILHKTGSYFSWVVCQIILNMWLPKPMRENVTCSNFIRYTPFYDVKCVVAWLRLCCYCTPPQMKPFYNNKLSSHEKSIHTILQYRLFTFHINWLRWELDVLP